MAQYRVLLFAGLAESCGCSEVTVELPHGGTIAALRQVAAQALPGLEGATYRVALNNRYVEETDVVPRHAELAFLPPVSGG